MCPKVLNRFSTARHLASVELIPMGRVCCDVCGLAFNDEESCEVHRKVCSEEVFDMMLGDVGKWFVSETDGVKMVGRIVGVRSCFSYDVRVVTFREDECGTLHVEIPSMPVELPSDAPFEECDQDHMDRYSGLMTSTFYGYLFRDTDGAV